MDEISDFGRMKNEILGIMFVESLAIVSQSVPKGVYIAQLSRMSHSTLASNFETNTFSVHV